MISEVFITCAVTGGGRAPKHENVPVTPREIAGSAIQAARRGASAVHLHVRDLKTRRGVLDLGLYQELVTRIRESDVDPVINLTTGEGCYLVLGSPNAPLPLSPQTDVLGALERLVHVEDLRPEICTLDCGSLISKADDSVMVNNIGTLRVMAARLQELGVKPELEAFEIGHLMMVHDMMKEGLIQSPPLIQMCMGVGYGVPPDLMALLAMAQQLPPGAVYSAFAVGSMQLPFVALAPLIGANVRVGLEDNLYLSRGQLASNAELVQRAAEILDRIGVRVMSPNEMRAKLKLKPKGQT